MRATRLSKGQNTPLPAARLTFRVETSPPGGVDTSAVVLGASGKVRHESDFVFYNQPTHPSGAIEHVTTGSGTESIDVGLAALEDGIERIMVAASVDSGTISRYERAVLVIADPDTDRALFEVEVRGEGSESAVVLAEIYRRDGAWKVRAISQGYDTGLAGLATDYGIDIADPATPSSAASAAPSAVSAATPRQAARAPGPAPAATDPAPAGPPSYIHPARHRRGPEAPVATPRPARRADQHAASADATARAHVGPRPVPAASTAEPPRSPRQAPRPAPRRAPTVAPGAPSLVTAHEAWEPLRRQAADHAGLLGRAIEAATRGFESARTNVLPAMTELDKWHNLMVDAWTTRFPKEPVPGTPDREPWSMTDQAPGLESWIGRVGELVNELNAKTVKVTSDGRRRYRWALASQYKTLVDQMPQVRVGLRQAAWERMAANGPTAGSRAASDTLRSWQALSPVPAPVGPYLTPITDGDIRRGPGPMTVQVGWVVPTSITFATERPATPSGHRSHSITVAGEHLLPVVVDLDAVGGYVTATPGVIESTVLGLLSALPPGQVRLDVFDPKRLGESANFLYGLGDSVESVIGQKVRTTEKELADLLVEIEEHITFVTQKYLQGSFDSLTAYNRASGDVAEPFRLLVLYDYPQGFGRDENFDREQLDRLAKILGAGRRCGVFTLIAHSGAAGQHANRVSQTLPWLSRTDFSPDLIASGLGLDHRTAAQLRGAGGGLADLTVHWDFRAVEAPSRDVAASLVAHIERGLRTAKDVRVDPDRVTELARLSMERDVARGTRERSAIAAAFDPASWWQASTIDDVTAVVGRLGATDTARIRLDSQTASSVLIGGRPGSGKSVLLHALIMSLTQQYGPDELALFLVDFKEGVEFKQYATHHMPQARVVAIESEREFGVSVLESLAEEIVRRGQLFRDAGSGEETNIGQYRQRTGATLPRVVLIIDEFQVMFDRDDKVGNRAAELLERVLRTGRAFGVHVILASQTIAGMPALGRHLPNLIPTRVVLQSADADSRLLLSDDNADAKLLSRPGEAILNAKGGLKDANQRFQSTYWEPEDRGWVLEHLSARAEQAGHRALPVVFEGQRGAAVQDAPPDTFTDRPGKHLGVPLGMPMTLAGPVRAELRREPGSNLLIVGDEPGPLLVTLAVLGALGERVELLDFGGDDEYADCLEAVCQAPTTRVSRRRGAREVLEQLTTVVDARLEQHDYAGATCVLAVHGLHRAREFDVNAEYEEQSESALLKKIVRDGPEVGVHVVAWADKKASVDRRMSYEVLREFGLRLCGPTSREDSLALIDSDEAAALHPGQAVLDDHDQSRRYRLRMFTAPDVAWTRQLLAGVVGSAG